MRRGSRPAFPCPTGDANLKLPGVAPHCPCEGGALVHLEEEQTPWTDAYSAP